MKIALKQKHYWILAGLWVAVIYSTLYIVRPICNFLKQTTPFELLMNVLSLAFLGCVLWLMSHLRPKWPYILLLILTLASYAYGLWTIAYPEEKLHFIEYGVLAFFIFQALKGSCRLSLGLIGAFLLTSMAGWIDEGIQYLLPNRYFQWEDVVLNSISGLLGLSLTFIYHQAYHEKILSHPGA